MVDYSLDGTGVRQTESFGEKVDQVNFEFNETQSSKGCAFNFYDESGNRVTTAGTANTQWDLFGNGQSFNHFYPGDGYNRWVDVTVIFDPSNGTATATFKDTQSGTERSSTGDLKNNSFPVEVEFASARNNNSWPYNSSDYTDTDIRFISSQSVLEAPTNVSAFASKNDVTLSWNAADGASQYDVLRAQSSGTTASDYSTIATVTDDGSASFSVTDTGLEDGEKFFYRVESVS